MKIYILFAICGKNVSNEVVETDITTFVKKSNANNYFGIRIVQIWENGKQIKNIDWEDFKKNLISYL